MAKIARSALALGTTIVVGASSAVVASTAQATNGCSPILNTEQCSAHLLAGEKPSLQYGDSGKYVSQLQAILNNKGFSGPQTGFFGHSTQTAVKSYQTSRGLAVTGVVDKETWEALKADKSAIEANSKMAQAVAFAKPVTSTSPSVSSDPVVTAEKSEKAKVAEISPVAKLKVEEPPRNLNTDANNATSASSYYAVSAANVSVDDPVRAKVVAFALAQVGGRYVWGGAGNGGFDCSGLTMASWATVGVSLPHSARAQMGLPRVSSGDIRPGDIVITNGGGHAMLYIGGGKVVQAMTPALGIRVTAMPSRYNAIVRPA